ncbi:MAG: putative permease, DMT superfamily [Rhodobacteraceae bacterium HLUCCA12]|nr:MAG: putative permease, DMT superfamily [Rhodobacteraceae bacterium HLUCCA12]
MTTISEAPDRPFLGILLMLGFCVLAPLSDATAKMLGDIVPLGQLLAVRFALQVAILLPLVWWAGQRLWPGRRVFWLLALRSVLHVVGIGAMFTALRYMPLADTLAIAFVMPFILLVLGHWLLSETVGAHRLAACAVGFGGTLLVIQPNFATVGLPALLPIVVAVTFALFMLVTRLVAKAIDAVAMQALSGLQALVLLAPVLMLGHGLHPALDIIQPQGHVLWLLLALGGLGTLGHLLMTWSLRFAPSATLAPMQYLEIPIATVIGWLVFSELPNGLAAAGIVVIMAAGLYIIARERRLARGGPAIQ